MFLGQKLKILDRVYICFSSLEEGLASESNIWLVLIQFKFELDNLYRIEEQVLG